MLPGVPCFFKYEGAAQTIILCRATRSSDDAGLIVEIARADRKIVVAFCQIDEPVVERKIELEQRMLLGQIGQDRRDAAPAEMEGIVTRNLPRGSDGLASGALEPVIAKTFEFDEIVAAHRYLESNEQFGKIVVTV